MADGKHCPACGKDIGICPIFTAGFPNRIRCPHCSARLSYRGITGVVFALLVGMLAVIVGAYFLVAAIPDLQPTTQLFVLAGVMFGAWAVLELAVVHFLRGNRELTCRDRTPPPIDSTEPSNAR